MLSTMTRDAWSRLDAVHSAYSAMHSVCRNFRTGNSLENFDPTQNSHTLKSSRLLRATHILKNTYQEVAQQGLVQ